MSKKRPVVWSAFLFFALVYLWYNILPALFSIVQLELRGGISLIAALMTWVALGEKVEAIIGK